MGRGFSTHDVSLIDTAAGSPEFGFMLIKNKDGTKKYLETMANPLQALQGVEGLEEDALDPEKQFAVGYHTSWIGGFGQYWADRAKPRRYYASYGVDASEDGLIKLGPKWTAVNWPTITGYTALIDGGLENWTTSTNLTSWTETKTGTATITQRTSPVHGGSNSAELVAGSGTVEIKQSLGTWNNEYRNKRFVASVWVYQDTGNAARLDIYDGVGTTTSTNSATTGSWVKLTVSRVLDSAATEATVKCRGIGASAITNFDDVGFGGYVAANANCYAEYNGLQYLSVGDILYKANSATSPTSWTYVTSFGQNITALYPGQVSGTAYLFIMIGSGNTNGDNGYYYDGTTLTQMTDASGTDASGDYMTTGTHNATADTFYISGRLTGVTTGAKFAIRTNTAPLAGAWSADTNVGDANTNITGLHNVNGVVYIAKEDSLWKVNTDGTVSMVVDYRMHFASTSGKNIIGWNNKVYIPVGNSSLIEYDPDAGVWQDISPANTISSATQAQISVGIAQLSSAQGDFDGRIMALAGGGGSNWLWLLQENGDVNNLFKGQYANVDGVGWIWHPVANTTMADVNCMAVSLLTTAPIVWAAHGTGDPGYYNLAEYEITDPTYTDPMLLTPYYTGNVRSIIKAVYQLILGLESITANVYATVQHRFYGTAAWGTALTFDGAAGTVTNGEDSNYMAASSSGTAIQFRINLKSNAATATPKVTYLKAYGKINPSEIPVITFEALLSDNQMGRNGARDNVLASRKMTCLNNVLASNWPVTFYDILGNSRTVDMLKRQWTPITVYGRNASYRVEVTLQRVTLS